jgi:CubicO group peptidase (beta-lactamase class C family)
MILSGGSYDGKRILSEAAVRQMTSIETGEIRINDNEAAGYGFGWSVLKRAAGDGRSAGSFGHGGAYKTMMWVDPPRELVLILLRHHSGGFLTPDGNRIEPVFFKTAIEEYAR